MIRAVLLLGSFFVYVQKGHTFPVLPVLEVSLRFAVLNSPFLLWGDSPPANFSYLHKAKAKVKFSKTNHRKQSEVGLCRISFLPSFSWVSQWSLFYSS